jgi:hypothetical protein
VKRFGKFLFIIIRNLKDVWRMWITFWVIGGFDRGCMGFGEMVEMWIRCG